MSCLVSGHTGTEHIPKTDKMSWSSECAGSDHGIFSEQTELVGVRLLSSGEVDIVITQMISKIDHNHYNWRFLCFTTITPPPLPPSSPFLGMWWWWWLQGVWCVVRTQTTHTHSIHPSTLRKTYWANQFVSNHRNWNTERASTQQSTLNTIKILFFMKYFLIFRETGKQCRAVHGGQWFMPRSVISRTKIFPEEKIQ